MTGAPSSCKVKLQTLQEKFRFGIFTFRSVGLLKLFSHPGCIVTRVGLSAHTATRNVLQAVFDVPCIAGQATASGYETRDETEIELKLTFE